MGPFAAGSRIAGYVLEEQIGQGGMAVVFRAHDERLDRRVALKILAPVLAADQEFRQRFIRESRAAAAVDDPHIVPVFEAGEASAVLFIAMRFVSGGDVGSVVRRTGSMSPEYAAGVVSQVASALDAAHARGLVHRDVKPSNMLLDVGDSSGRPDHVYLSDFGLSKAQVTSAKITATGEFLGTLAYVSPEQVNGDPVGPPGDQYSLACTAFELLSGIPPFDRDTGMALMYAHLHHPPPTLSSLRAELPEAVDSVFARALAKAPGDRYPSCREFADAMRLALGLPSYRGDTGSGGRPAVSPLVRVPETLTATRADETSAGDTAQVVLTEQAQTEHPLTQRADLEEAATRQVATGQTGLAASGPTSSRPWWRSRMALVAGVVVVVLLGVGMPLLLRGSGGPSGSVIFSSDFSGSGDGWQVQPTASDGHRSNGSFYVQVASSGNTEIAVPVNASQVYPSAPADLRIDVTAQGTRGPASQIHYGIACRDANGSAYVFDVQGNRASIGKLVQGSYEPLVSQSSNSIHVGAANQLTATCASVAGQTAVRLSFAVNGTQVTIVTDRNSPLSSGTVGFFTGFYSSSIPNGVEAAFQNFVVRRT